MHLLFLDESGRLDQDTLFALGGIAVRDANWHELRKGYTLHVQGPEGGQIAVEATLLQVESKSSGTRAFEASVRVKSVGTARTAPITVDLTVRTAGSEIDLLFPDRPHTTGGHVTCERVQGSGTASVHVSCRVSALPPGTTVELSWIGETEKNLSAGETIKLVATAAHGSDLDDPADNTDSSHVTVLGR